jgi:hypothetical protein
VPPQDVGLAVGVDVAHAGDPLGCNSGSADMMRAAMAAATGAAAEVPQKVVKPGAVP